MADDRGQRTDDRGQKTEAGMRKWEKGKGSWEVEMLDGESFDCGLLVNQSTKTT